MECFEELWTENCFCTIKMIGPLFLLKFSFFAFSEPTSSPSGMIKLNDECYTDRAIFSVSSKAKIEGKKDVVLGKTHFCSGWVC